MPAYRPCKFYMACRWVFLLFRKRQIFVFSYKNALTFAFGYTMIIEKQMSTDQSERKRQEKISLSRRLS